MPKAFHHYWCTAPFSEAILRIPAIVNTISGLIVNAAA